MVRLISLQFDNGFGPLFPGCREPIVDSIVTLESASFSGITAELPTIEVSFLSIDIDLDDLAVMEGLGDAADRPDLGEMSAEDPFSTFEIDLSGETSTGDDQVYLHVPPSP